MFNRKRTYKFLSAY